MTRLYYIRKGNRTQETGEKKEGKEEERRRIAELGNTKETLEVPTSLNNFPTTAVAPYWISQRLHSKMYNQTPVPMLPITLPVITAYSARSYSTSVVVHRLSTFGGTLFLLLRRNSGSCAFDGVGATSSLSVSIVSIPG